MKRDWGTFKLADRIAAKVKAGGKINYVFSYQASGIPLFSPQYAAGFETDARPARDLPVGLRLDRPSAERSQPAGLADRSEARRRRDRLHLDRADDSDSTTAIINKLMGQGIPVFTVGVTSRGHEFTNFTQVPQLEGETAGKIVLDWMKANNKDLKVFAVSGGDPTQFWAEGRMKGFREAIAKAIRTRNS